MASHFDTIIIGAGIAGSACARLLAAGGRKVVLIDRRPFEKAGARWINGVPLATFHAVGLPPPVAPELHGVNEPFILVSPSGQARIRLEQPGLLGADMRLLGSRLRAEAIAAGATGLDRTAIHELHLEGNRISGLSTDRGELFAPLIIDASGLPAVARRVVFPHWPDVPREHLCLAAQQVHQIHDIQGAQAWLERNQVRNGETLAATGLAGGYSVLNVRVDFAQEEVSILSGSILDHPDRPSGRKLLDQFLAREAWIGQRKFGGSSSIPVRRPYARLVAPGLALLGDSACQVFPAHGSGIALGLRAAQLLAEVVLAAPPESAGDEARLWKYSATFHHTFGGLLTSYDLLRRLAQRLTPEESELLLATGLTSPGQLTAALNQQLPPLSVKDLAGTLARSVRAPRLAARLARTAARIPACLAVARTYPLAPDLEQLSRFEARVARLCGERPDPVC